MPSVGRLSTRAGFTLAGRVVLLDVVLRLPDRHNGPRLGRVDENLRDLSLEQIRSQFWYAEAECEIELLAVANIAAK